MNAKEAQVLYLICFIIGLGIGICLYAFFTVNIFLSLLIAFISSTLLFLLIGIPCFIFLHKARTKNV